MSDKMKKKKKLVVKTSGKAKSIAEQIAQQRKKKDEVQQQKSVQFQSPSEQTKSPPAQTPRGEGGRPQGGQTSGGYQGKPQQQKRPYKSGHSTGAPEPKVVFETGKPETTTRSSGPGKPRSEKQKSQFREDILRNEEHKKFFLKQHESHSPKGGIDANPTSSVPKKIKITEYIQVGELARKLNIKSSDIIGKLMQMGVMATITQSIDAEAATLVAAEYGCEAEVISLYEETVIEEIKDKPEDLQVRPPVVTIMGHVDHGKTKLLDALRETDIASGEAGGITQHIGAYQISTPKGKITFLDTPGHAAFTAMRARGAQLTDIVVLVVAANDGVMPQTIEAIKHAQDANVPIIVAVNKIDLPEANSEKIMQQLTQYNLVPEAWGGTTPVVEISALQKLNLDKLEETIITTAEILELKANPSKSATGVVVEAKLDQGRGPVATILLSSGTLKQGDAYVVGLESGRVRAMLNDRGTRIKEAFPATPVEILGLNGVPNAGDPFHVMASEREAKEIMEKRQELNRQQQAQKMKKVKLENLSQMIEDGNVQELKLIIKGDVRGSVEAIQESLEQLSVKDIRVSVIYGATGEITESDVMLASAGSAMIIAFNTRANARVREMADREGVEIKMYNIIYQVIDDIKAALTGMIAPDISYKVVGEVQVREKYKISNVGNVAGCMVTSGYIKRGSRIRVVRDGNVIHETSLKSLKRFQDEAAEVKEGFECGILLDGYNDFVSGDMFEVVERVETARTLEQMKQSDKEAADKSTTE